MSTDFPRFDGAAVWAQLEPEQQAEIGAIALELVCAWHAAEHVGDDLRATPFSIAAEGSVATLDQLLCATVVAAVPRSDITTPEGFPLIPSRYVADDVIVAASDPIGQAEGVADNPRGSLLCLGRERAVSVCLDELKGLRLGLNEGVAAMVEEHFTGERSNAATQRQEFGDDHIGGGHKEYSGRVISSDPIVPEESSSEARRNHGDAS